MIGDIVKAFILYKIVNSPLTVFVCTFLITGLLLMAGAFIKFKNGIFSWLCFFTVLALPLSYVVLTAIAVAYPPEDLKLSKPHVLTYKEIQADKIIAKKGLRREATYSLLGIDVIKTQQRLEDVRSFITAYSVNNTITYKTSEVYNGIILYDDAGNDLNLMMIQKGYVRNAFVAPVQYVKAAEVAQKNKVGIWAAAVAGTSDTHFYHKLSYLVSFIIINFMMGVYFRRVLSTYGEGSNS